MFYVLSCIIGFLLGSIPTAYIITKKFKGIDITETGSGNPGAMNTYEVSNSKILGFIVFAVDALKGLASVYLALIFFPINFVFPALALLFAVFSHCFNPWLSFKGGRGLATAFGGALLLVPFLDVIWILIWLVVFGVKKDIIFANIWATLMSLIITLSTGQIVFNYSYPTPDSISTLIIFISALLMLIFIKHIDSFKEIIKKQKHFREKVIK
jgi:acyl phosphate:glycerol-3-phosphate acyltransferase